MVSKIRHKLIARRLALLLFWAPIVTFVLSIAAPIPATATDVPFEYRTQFGSIKGIGSLNNGHFNAVVPYGGGQISIQGDIRFMNIQVDIAGALTLTTNWGRNDSASGTGLIGSGDVEISFTINPQSPMTATLRLKLPAEAITPSAQIVSQPEIDPIDESYVAVQPADVREMPDGMSVVKSTIRVGEIVNVMGKVRGKNWYLVSQNQQALGYVVAGFLAPQSPQASPAAVVAAPPPAAPAASVVAPRVASVPGPAVAPPIDPIDEAYVAIYPAKVRNNPDPLSPRVKTIAVGQKINVVGKLKGSEWYLVSENDKPIGYVVASQLVPEVHYKPTAISIVPAAIPAPLVPAATASSSTQPAIPAALANLDFGRYEALVIGNDKYQNGLPALHTAANDARSVAEVLRTEYGFKVILLINATRPQIIGALAKLRESLTWDDNLLIYYAGHGNYDQEADQGYWLPVDAAPKDPSNWVSNTDITNMLRALQARHVMVVADSCYSGTLTRDATMGIKDADYIQRMVQKKARTVMTSGGLEPVGDAGSSGHSVFASAFITALQQNTTVIDAQSFFAKVREPVVLAAPQTPEYSNLRFAGHEGGDFIFVRK
jgi:hypothetical protein